MQKNIFILLTVGVFLTSLLTNCAREAAPTGGLRDTIAPRIVFAEPGMNELRFKEQGFQIEFNEYVKGDKIADALVVSPPLKVKPAVKVRGKKLIVSFKEEELAENTTYIFNFGDAIKDLNEGNVYPNLTYVFSTGDVIDSLELSGKVIDSKLGLPAKNVSVFLSRNLSDTSAINILPSYVTKTDEEGNFRLSNLKADTFALVALHDLNGNFLYDPEMESIAFSSKNVIPLIKANEQKISDSLAIDSVNLDTIVQSKLNQAFKDKDSSHVIYLFKESSSKQYLKECRRVKRERFDVSFNSKPIQDSLAILNIDNDQYFLEITEVPDSIIIWLSDTSLINNDTLCVHLSYLLLDSSLNVYGKVDTLCPSLSNEPKQKISVSIKNKESIISDSSIFVSYNGNVMHVDTSKIKVFETTDTVVALNSEGEFYTEPVLRYSFKSPRPYFIPGRHQSVKKSKFLWSKFYVNYSQDVAKYDFEVKTKKGVNLLEHGRLEKDLTNNSVLFWFDTIAFNGTNVPDVIIEYKSDEDTGVDTFLFSKDVRKLKRNKLMVDILPVQAKSLFLNNMLRLRLSNPISTIDTSLIAIVKITDSLRQDVEVISYNLHENSRYIDFDCDWNMNSSYAILISKGAIVDCFGQVLKPSELSFNTQKKQNEVLKKDIPYHINTKNFRSLEILPKLDAGRNYRLEIAPGLFSDIRGFVNDSVVVDFKTFGSEHFGSLEIVLDSAKQSKSYVFRLEKGKKSLNHRYTSGSNIHFSNLEPGEYTLSYFVDNNNDGLYTSGNYLKRLLPEIMSFYPEKIVIKQNWDSKIHLH